MATQSKIVVSGAREHNLKDVTVELPRDALVVITGLSGSGKSSLAFDTIYAEGQRRYVESLSAYARQFLGQMDKPDVDSIEGLSPAISIDQKTTSRNPRSTVGTVTEIYDYLRLLWARVGKPHCHVCGEPIAGQSAEQIIDQVHRRAPGGHALHGARADRARAQGRVRQAAARSCAPRASRALRSTASCGCSRRRSSSTRSYKHDIAVVVDRLVMRAEVRKRLADSVETAVGARRRASSRSSTADRARTAARRRHAALQRAVSPASLRHLDPRARAADLLLQLAARRLPALHRAGLADGDRPGAGRARTRRCRSARARSRRGPTAPRTTTSRSPRRSPRPTGSTSTRRGRSCPRASATCTCTAPAGERVKVTYRNRYGRTRRTRRGSRASSPTSSAATSETDSECSREKIEEYMSLRPCPECNGARLRPESRAVLVGGTGDPRVLRR